MGVDTNGVVATSCKDIYFVSRRIVHALDAQIKRAMFQKYGKHMGPKAGYRMCRVELHTDFPGVSIAFQYEKEERRLMVFFDCDCDHDDLAPQTLSLKLGCWGESEFLMKTALDALRCLGPVYLDLNDCDNDGLALLDEEPKSFLQERAEGNHHTTLLDLRSWLKLWDRNELPGTFESVFGMTRQEAEAITELGFKDAGATLDRLVEQLAPATV